MKGSQGIPALYLTTLNKLVSKLDRAPNMFFTNLFTSQSYPSDSIEWEIEFHSGGMTPFVAPGSVAPAVGIDGISRANAKAAYWKEKMFFDEVFLNNLREPGTYATYQTAQRQLVKGMSKLKNRCDRRMEWMTSQMLLHGELTYLMQGGTKVSVQYGVPDRHKIVLDDSRRWDNGSAKNAIEDIFDAKQMLSDDAGVVPNYFICNSMLLKTLMMDESIQGLLKKSTFGNGDLFQNPQGVIGTLIGAGNMMIYDELYEVQGWITNVSGLTLSVDDSSDFHAGAKARLYDMTKYNTWYDYNIAAVDQTQSTVTLEKINDTDPDPNVNIRAHRDKIVMRRKFIDDHTFFMFSDTADGQKIAEFMLAPFGNNRNWGFYADSQDEWDPEGVWMRVQNKGLPVLYVPETTMTLTVSSDEEYGA